MRIRRQESDIVIPVLILPVPVQMHYSPAPWLLSAAVSYIFWTSRLLTPAPSFGSSRLKSRELFFIAAGTDKCLFLTFHIHFHTFMTLGTTGIGSSGQGFFITALSVLTYKHFCILSIHCQKLLSAVRADLVCKIIMPEGSPVRF